MYNFGNTFDLVLINIPFVVYQIINNFNTSADYYPFFSNIPTQ